MPIYMKYEGIEGPLTGQYEGWFELSSCQLENQQNKDDSSNFEVVITKNQDKCSINLFKESVSGKGKKVIIDFVNEADTPDQSIELENAVITIYIACGGYGSVDQPLLESLTLEATKISYLQKSPKVSSNLGQMIGKMIWGPVIYW